MTPVLLAELIAAASVATDISMCHAVETRLATSVTAARLAWRARAGGGELDLHAPATPAGRGNRQRDAVLAVDQDRMQVEVERSLSDLHELVEEPVEGLPPAVLTD